jgi:hypothetical protein
MSRNPSAEEAAAIAAAIERFRGESAPAGEEEAEIGLWHRAALVEGVMKMATSQHLEGGPKWLS